MLGQVKWALLKSNETLYHSLASWLLLQPGYEGCRSWLAVKVCKAIMLAGRQHSASLLDSCYMQKEVLICMLCNTMLKVTKDHF